MKLSEVRSTRRSAPPKVVVYGPTKVGKSTFGAGAPGAVFLPLEDGQAALDAMAFPLARTWAEVCEAIGELLGEHDYQTLVVDSIDWLEPLIWAEVCRVHSAKSIEQVLGGYGKGYLEADALWRYFLDGLDALAERGVTPVLLAHDQMAEVKPPDATAYQQAGLKLHKRAAAIIAEWADVIGYASARPLARSEDAGGTKAKPKTRQVMLGYAGRTLRLGQHPAYVSGSRYRLPEEIPLTWTDFAAAMAAAQQGE